MHLNRRNVGFFSSVILTGSIIACSTGSSVSTVTMPPANELVTEVFIVTPVTVTLSPSDTPEPAFHVETRVFPENGFSISFLYDWDEVRKENEVLFTDPDNPLNRLIIRNESSQYSLSWVDEQVSEALLEVFTLENEDISASLIYPAKLGTINNGRAFDYVITKGGETVYGGVTIGTQVYGETWVIQWEAARNDFAEFISFFTSAVDSFTPLMG